MKRIIVASLFIVLIASLFAVVNGGYVRRDIYVQGDATSFWFYRSNADFPESSLTGDRTVTVWIRPEVTVTQFIVSKYTPTGSQRSFAFSIGTPGELHCYTNATGGTGAAHKTRNSTNMDYSIGKWTHIAVTYDASDASCIFYQDGRVLTHDGGVLATSTLAATCAFTIGGADYIVAPSPFGGGLHNVCYYDDIRTPAEIRASAGDWDYDASGDGNIIGQWIFNEDDGSTEIDNKQGDAGRDMKVYRISVGTTSYTNAFTGRRETNFINMYRPAIVH